MAIDPNTLALVSVVAGATTAIAVPLINAVAQARVAKRRFDHERQLKQLEQEHQQHGKDFDELRKMLDDADVALVKLFEATAAMQSRLRGAKTTDVSYFTDHLAAYTNTRDVVLGLTSRLRIRLGRDHDVTTAVAGALDAATEDGSVTMTAIVLERGEDAIPDLDTVVERRSVWYRERWRFLDEAQKLVGSPLAQASLKQAAT